ncbi:MAG: sigma 54-interacting transcriptional regulator, partial [Nitrospirota bacterium]|nr:sigma 54-interacting transcriptional regulator [Nitrospirota bacterium]
RTIKVDVRVITATNKNLSEEIKKGAFREDLYYRINVIAIHVPPLRERREDIPLLARHFLSQIIREQGLREKALPEETAELLMRYDWPGNVRELRNLMERVAIMAQGGRILPGDMAMISGESAHPGVVPFLGSKFDSLREARAAFERYYITERLKENNWNVTRTAEDIKIERSNLHRKMKLLGIEEKGGANCQSYEKIL